MSQWKNVLDIPAISRPAEYQIIECTRCGSKANASCNCGVSYFPAHVRAAEAVKAHPEKSDRAIAAEIGVDHKTVGKARKEAIGEYSPVDAPTGVDAPVDEPRIGLDGKTRRMPVRAEQPRTEDAAQQSFQQTLYEQACVFVGRMTAATRQRFLDHLRRKYSAQEPAP